MRRTTLYLSAFLLLAGITAARPARAQSADEKAILKLFGDFSAAIKARDVNKIMSLYSHDPHAVFFDAYAPREYVGYSAYEKGYKKFFDYSPGTMSATISEVQIGVSGTLAYAYGIDTWVITPPKGKPDKNVFRFTDVLRREGGKWVIFHEHVSFPVDPATGKPDFLSKR
jgi:ketosteroid isomerase-like protein